MSKFDKEKEIIKDLMYDPNCNGGAYTNDDQSIIYKSTLYSDGTGKKDDLYTKVKNGNLNEPHEGTHLKVQNSGEWEKSAHNEDKAEKTTTSGQGCYLTSACIKYYSENFDDNCYELNVLRWFRDIFVSSADIEHYYKVAPIIVEAIESLDYKEIIYDYIFENVIDFCINAIEKGEYVSAYERYKNSILIFENNIAKPFLEKKLLNTFKHVIKPIKNK